MEQAIVEGTSQQRNTHAMLFIILRIFEMYCLNDRLRLGARFSIEHRERMVIDWIEGWGMWVPCIIQVLKVLHELWTWQRRYLNVFKLTAILYEA